MSCSLRTHGQQHAGFPVHHQLQEPAPTHVHWIGEAIQPSHLVVPYSSCLQSFPASGSFPSVPPIRWSKYWSFSSSFSLPKEYLPLSSFSIVWFDLLAVQGTLKSSPTPQLKSINSSGLSFLYGPTLTSIHDYWKNHSFDCTDLCQ